MPFGAEMTPAGARFRLWAPAARRFDLALGWRLLPMQPREDGWFERLEPSAAAGAHYRYRIDGESLVPDPASRFQPKDVEGPSEVVDPSAFAWEDGAWHGRPWAEAVIYELHVGAFSAQGNYAGVRQRLPQLRELGVTAIELMPLADFSGKRNWGYDGVLPYAPDSAYGRPEQLKQLVQAAHAEGLMVFLDVVYNHFGPKGNYLRRYAPQFFTDRVKTPWGEAIDFSERQVREFFVHNALYWLSEYHLDGLRLDAVHAIADRSATHILDEIAERVRESSGAERRVHLVLENDANQARLLARPRYDAQWNDDAHHACHVLATGESDGYYADYADAPAQHLARCLAEGFAYQGARSPFRGQPRGEPSAALPPTAFIAFLQNHDQVGNRAHGERLASLAEEKALKTLMAIILLAPSPPMLFMGEEWGCRQPFLFFCDFPAELGRAVREGRRSEFARFAAFRAPEERERIPDPLALATFTKSRLRWRDREGRSGAAWLALYRELLRLRREEIRPRIDASGHYRMLGARAFEVRWDRMAVVANCGEEAVTLDSPPPGRRIWGNGDPGASWSAHWWVSD
jgi:malto-oligosyltrehalose trehalohydrolase